MNRNQQIKTSRFLSLVLRHKPESIGLKLDAHGWAVTDELIEKLNGRGFQLGINELKALVANNDKQRFIFSPDYSKIRANQGHSINVDLELEEKTPPEFLYHGTATKNLESIKEKGLVKKNRHHVHLSDNQSTALSVGQRYGTPIILKVNSGIMYKNGMKFYQSANGVWLTDSVDSDYIEF